MDDERELIDQEIKKLSGELSKWQIGSKEHMAVIEALKELHAIRMNDIRAENERIEKNMTLDLRKEELEFKVFECEQKAKMSKRSDWLGVLKAVVCGAISIFGVFCLDEIKEEQGFIDKDKFSMIRTLFPKG